MTNDDGYAASGINHLLDALGDDFTVTMVAPAEEQSGMGHAFTHKKPLFFNTVTDQHNRKIYSVSGTPADCVKFGVSYLYTQIPDFVVSGINFGTNTGIAGFYSGTVAAAREASFWDIPSVAFSLAESSEPPFPAYAEIARKLMHTLFFKLPVSKKIERLFFNVNFPSCHPDLCRGIKFTRQSLACYRDRYTPVTLDNGTVGYILNGSLPELEQSDEFDTYAVMNNYIAITPLHFDATAATHVSSLLNVTLDNII